jgi:hypothetical protein
MLRCSTGGWWGRAGCQFRFCQTENEAKQAKYPKQKRNEAESWKPRGRENLFEIASGARQDIWVSAVAAQCQPSNLFGVSERHLHLTTDSMHRLNSEQLKHVPKVMDTF